MEKKATSVVAFYCIVSIIAIIYFSLPFYILIFAPFLLISIGLAAASRFKTSTIFGFFWTVITGAILIPLFIIFFFTSGIVAITTYFGVGLIFHALVCVSNWAMYKLSKQGFSRVRTPRKGVVESDISHYCRYCGAEIKEGEVTCPNCSSSLMED